MARFDPDRNRRRIIRLSILAGIALVVTGCLYALFQFNAGRQKLDTGEVIGQAREAYDSKEYGRVIELLESPKSPSFTIPAIQNDVELLKIYVQARRSKPLPNGGHYIRIVPALQQIVESTPDDEASRQELFTLLLYQQRYSDVQRLTENLVKQRPEVAEFWRLLGDAHANLGSNDKALAAYKEAARLEPLHVPTQHAVVQLLQSTNADTSAFVEQAQAQYQAHPQDPRAILIQAIALNTLGRRQEAVTLVLGAAELEPVDEDFIPVMVKWLDQFDLYSASAAYLDRVAKGGIDSEAGHEAVLRAYDAGDLEGVMRRLKDADPASAHPDLVAVWTLASNAQADHDKTRSLIENLVGRNDLLAQAWAEVLPLIIQPQLEPARVIDKVIAVMGRDAEDPASQAVRDNAYLYQLLGESYLGVGELGAAEQAMQTAAVHRPSWGKPHRMIATVLLQQNQPKRAMQHAQLAWDRQSSLASMALLIQAQLQAVTPANTKAVSAALSNAGQFLDQVPDHPGLLPVTIDLLVRTGQKEQAAGRIDAVLRMDPPASTQMLTELADLSRRHGLGLEPRIEQAITQHYGTTPQLLLNQASTLARQGQPTQGRELIEQAMPPSPSLEWQAALGQYLSLIGAADASTYWIALADNNPGHRGLQSSALQVAGVREDLAFATRAIDRLRQLGGERSTGWRIEKARLLMLNNPDDKALSETLTLLREAESIAPQSLETQLELARCLILRDDLADAEVYARQAKALGPNQAGVMLLLGHVQHQLGHYSDARLELVQVANDPNASPRLRLSACALLVDQGDRRDARQALEAMRQAGTADTPALMLLARIHILSEQFTQADALCIELMKSPDMQSVAFVASYYAQTNRPELAEQARAKARTLGLSEADQLTLDAQALVQGGELKSALNKLEQAAKAQPNNPERWRSAARVALLLALPGQAIALCEAGLKQAGDDPGMYSVVKNKPLIQQLEQDNRLAELAVSVLSRPMERDAALQALKLIKAGKDAESTAKNLAELADKHPGFQALNEITADRLIESNLNQLAFDLGSGAMMRFPNSANLARSTTIAAYRLGEWNALLSAAQTWGQRSTADRHLSDLMIAAAQDALQRYSAVIQTLAPHISSLPGGPDNNPQHYMLYTRALVRTEQADKAWALLGPLLPSSPLARYAALQRIGDDLNQAQTAQDWLAAVTRATSDEPAEQFELSRAAFAAGVRLKNPELLQAARTSIDKLLAQAGPHPAQAYNMQGLIAREQDDITTAEAAFRQVLKAEPNSPQVLNNLAMVLVTRGGSALSEAEQLAVRATELQPEDANLLDTLAIVRLRRGKLDEAIQSITRAIQLEPDNPAWRLTQADILEAQGKIQQAQTIRQRYGAKDN